MDFLTLPSRQESLDLLTTCDHPQRATNTTMSLPDDFIASFGNFGLESPPSQALQDSTTDNLQRHVLCFHYPCLGLLPEGHQVHLDPPTDIERRHAPSPRQDRHQDFDATYFHFWNDKTSPPEWLIPGYHYAFAEFLSHLRGGAAGKTDFGIVRYHANGGVKTGIVVNTVFDNRSPTSDTFELDESQWQAFIMLADQSD